MERDLHFTPFLSLANVIGDENIKVKSWDVIRIPAAQHMYKTIENIIASTLAVLFCILLSEINSSGIEPALRNP
jgi:hypothetical protein